MKYIFVIAGLLGSFLVVPSLGLASGDAISPEVASIIADNYQDSTSIAVDLLVDESYRSNADNKVTYRIHVLTKILTPAGLSLGTVYLPHNDFFEKFDVNFARTIQQDGSVTDATLANDESPFSKLPYYSDMKVKKITFPGIKPGSYIEYEAEKEIDYKAFPAFCAISSFPVNKKMVLKRLTIDLPVTKVLKFNAVRILEKDPVVSEKDGRRIYKWGIKANKVYLAEPYMPAYSKYGSYISLTTIESWDDVYKGCKNVFADQAEPDQKIKDKVRELLDGDTDRNAVIEKLYNYVSQEIQYVAVEFGFSAFKPYPASAVFQNRYGDCKGKSALLIAMLQEAGVPAYFALVSTTNINSIESGIPSIFFNHCIVAIPDGDRFIFLDPTADMDRFDVLPFVDQGADAFIIKENNYQFVTTPIANADKTIKHTNTSVVLSADGSAKFHIETKSTGQLDWLNRTLRKKDNLTVFRERTKKKIDSLLPNAHINDEDIKSSEITDLSQPYNQSIEATVSEYARKADNLFMFKVPLFEDDLFRQTAGLERRNAELYIGFPFISESHVVITIPAGYSIKYLPKDLTSSNSVFSYSANFIKQGDRQIIIDEKTSFLERQIPIGKYPQFRAIAGKIRNMSSENIILEKVVSAS